MIGAHSTGERFMATMALLFQYHPGVKQFGFRSGPTFWLAWSGSKLFAKVISRQQKSTLWGKDYLLILYFLAKTLAEYCYVPHFSPYRLAPIVKLNYAYSKVFFSLISQSYDGWVCSKGWKKRQLWWENNVWIISLGQNILIKSMNIRQGASLLRVLSS